MENNLPALRAWALAEFKRRTRLLNLGEGKIEWIDPSTRVSFSEVTEKVKELGIEMNVVDLRLAMDGVLPRS